VRWRRTGRWKRESKREEGDVGRPTNGKKRGRRSSDSPLLEAGSTAYRVVGGTVRRAREDEEEGEE
jgi:hypothetical protein